MGAPRGQRALAAVQFSPVLRPLGHTSRPPSAPHQQGGQRQNLPGRAGDRPARRSAPELVSTPLCPQNLPEGQMVGPPELGWGRPQDSPKHPARRPPTGASPFQRGDAFVPAGGPPGSEAGAGLPGAVPVPRVLPLPPALRVPALIGLHPGGGTWGSRSCRQRCRKQTGRSPAAA